VRAQGRLAAALALAALAPAAARGAATLSIAAAANLSGVLEALDAEYHRVSPDAVLATSFGSSGGLVAQIRNGAPFDVLLSADVEYPRQLIRSGDARADSLTPFAVGRLVVWTVRPGVDVTDIAALVRSPAVRTLAVANADSAPYGRAAKQALTVLGLWDEARPKLVTAENIAQAAQFVGTGNADAGLVAMSAVLSPALKGRGTWREVPQRLYDPIVQAAVVTAHGEGNPEARRYLGFLRSEAAGRVLVSLGYGLPGPGR
jgi:molybdate transport system substrate-binding protein